MGLHTKPFAVPYGYLVWKFVQQFGLYAGEPVLLISNICIARAETEAHFKSKREHSLSRRTVNGNDEVFVNGRVEQNGLREISKRMKGKGEEGGN